MKSVIRLSRTAAVAALISASATVAFAQTYNQPAARQPSPAAPSPATAAPTTPAAPNANAAAPEAATTPEAVAPAPAAAAGTAQQQQPNSPRAELAHAKENLAAVTRKLQAQADASPEVATATKSVTEAKEAYDQASANAVASLANNPQYKSAQAAAAAARQKMNDLAASGNATADARVAAATAALNAKENLNRIQSQVLDADPAVQQAKTNYTQAVAELTKLRQQNVSLAQNPEWVQARDAVQAAQEKVTQSDRAAAEARQAAYQQQAAQAQRRQPQQQPPAPQPGLQPLQEQFPTPTTPQQPARRQGGT